MASAKQVMIVKGMLIPSFSDLLEEKAKLE